MTKKDELILSYHNGHYFVNGIEVDEDSYMSIANIQRENAELKKENEKLLEHRRITSWNNHKILKMHTSMARNLRQENEAIMAINEKLLKEQTK